MIYRLLTPRRRIIRRTLRRVQPVYYSSIGGAGNDIISINNTTNGSPSPVHVTIVTTPTYTATATDYFICVEHSATVVITLPVGILGTVYIVKDCDGNASPAAPIIVQGTLQNVDGGTATINSPFGSLSFIFDGTKWNIV
jgi:hypothetical protein